MVTRFWRDLGASGVVIPFGRENALCGNPAGEWDAAQAGDCLFRSVRCENLRFAPGSTSRAPGAPETSKNRTITDISVIVGALFFWAPGLRKRIITWIDVRAQAKSLRKSRIF